MPIGPCLMLIDHQNNEDMHIIFAVSFLFINDRTRVLTTFRWSKVSSALVKAIKNCYKWYPQTH